MATHAGKEGTIKVGANAIAEVKEFEIDEVAEVLDNTTLDNTNGYRTHLQTFNSWSGSALTLWDETDANGQATLTIGASVTINAYPEGDANGDTFLSGDITVTGVKVKSSFDGLVERELSFTGTGALTIDTVS